MKELAPIVLFVYNRPWHTLQTLEALAANKLADGSILYIYADGIKLNATNEDKESVEKVRQVIRKSNWCKEVHIIERDDNIGLAESIIQGVTQIVNRYGKIIVLEDDIVTSPGFLKFMNDALMFYENEEKVMHISGYMFPTKGNLPATFFYNTASCWGWATWKRAWKNFNPDVKSLMKEIDKRNKKEQFNVDNSYDFYGQLLANIDGRLKTWAVKWYASFFLMDGLALHPYPSLVNNIGHDGMGENCSVSNDFAWKRLAPSIKIERIPLAESRKARDSMIQYYRNHFSQHPQRSIFGKMKSKSGKLLPEKIKHGIRLVLNEQYRLNFEKKSEIERIAKIERYQNGTTNLLSTTGTFFVDSASFLFIYEEIFNKEIYKFKTNNPQPYIIDCGANIGLGVIYFKQLFPNSKIVAFEPDNKIFEVLQRNVQALNLPDVELIKKACWDKATKLLFHSEGADGGRTASNLENENLIEVETISLKEFLQQKTDFLKIDIEGAEFEVLQDIENLLVNVSNIFIEFHSFVGKAQSLPEILTILKNAGFRLHLSSPGLNSLSPFVHLNTYANMDNQLNIYGMRVPG